MNWLKTQDRVSEHYPDNSNDFGIDKKKKSNSYKSVGNTHFFIEKKKTREK